MSVVGTDVRRVRRAQEPLRAFNEAGVLAAADVHVAMRFGALTGERDPGALLATALAVRAPRLGHVFVDLATIASTAVVDVEEPVDVAALPWPDPDAWVKALAESALVADTGELAPLRLEGSALYLDRYWREERRLAVDLRALAEHPPGGVDEGRLQDGIARLFPEGDERQRDAAAAAVRSRAAVIAGGPGTGKTTTVARTVALLLERGAERGRMPLVALAAPTGKAAARLQEAVHEEAERMAISGEVRDALRGLGSATLHRLLGWRPDSHSRFRHHRHNRLPHDVVVVDESSMVSLSTMSRLVEAVRRDAQLILVGDPGQLASIEAGAVLGDVVGPVAAGEPPDVPIARGIVVLDRVHRYGEDIGRLADAIHTGDADAAVAALGASEEIEWIAVDAAGSAAQPALAGIRAQAVDAARAVHDAAAAGDASAALTALGSFRLLCAHRRGPDGVAAWMERLETWARNEIDGLGHEGRWYTGRPLLVTENDYALQLYNGDTGVVVTHEDGRRVACFERRGRVVAFGPTRLGAVETVYAMTIHKSQGSQFDAAVVVLPDPRSRILTRELLYTAVTRARRRLVVVGTEEAIRAGIDRPVARASGLRERLWTGSA